jgi:hypothetical protein
MLRKRRPALPPPAYLLPANIRHAIAMLRRHRRAIERTILALQHANETEQLARAMVDAFDAEDESARLHQAHARAHPPMLPAA